MPKVYAIVEVEVTDPATYEDYKAAAAPIIANYGGRYIVRGGPVQSVEGEPVKGRVVVIEFPDMAAAQSFVDAEEYRPVAAIRHKSANSRLFLVEGMPD